MTSSPVYPSRWVKNYWQRTRLLSDSLRGVSPLTRLGHGIPDKNPSEHGSVGPLILTLRSSMCLLARAHYRLIS
eukprot:15304692-Heterocapsa_arctica.AAC.1